MIKDIVILTIVGLMLLVMLTILVMMPFIVDIYNTSKFMTILYTIIYDRQTYHWYLAARRNKKMYMYSTEPEVTPRNFYIAPIDDDMAVWYDGKIVITPVYPRLVDAIIERCVVAEYK